MLFRPIRTIARLPGRAPAASRHSPRHGTGPMPFTASSASLGASPIFVVVRFMPPLFAKRNPSLRVFLQDGKNDLNLYAGSWYIANQDVAAALEYAGYDSTFVVGTEGHNGKHGCA